MNNNINTLLIALISFMPSYAKAVTMLNPLEGADPTIFVDEGKYYLSCTDHQSGFVVLTSDDLYTWSAPDGNRQQLALKAGDGVYGERYFFAPQFFKNGNHDYMLTYSANLNIAVAHSSDIAGPYRQNSIGYVSIDGAQNIDSFLFKDDNGKYYLYYAHYVDESARGGVKGNTIRVAEFDINVMQIVPGTERECLRAPSEPGVSWENTWANASTGVDTVEGPTVIKLDGKYYLFYTANDYTCVDYAVGYATSDTPMGPWTRYGGNPIISRNIVGENGSGHGDYFIGVDGKPYYVYHVHERLSAVHPRQIRIAPLSMVKNNGIYEFSVEDGNIIHPKVLYSDNTQFGYPKVLYAVGTTDGYTWDVNSGAYPLYGDGQGKYIGEIKVWEANGNAQLAFFPTLGSWENRYAPKVDHEILRICEPSATLATGSSVGNNCYFLSAGDYCVEVDLVAGSVTVLPKQLYAVGLLGTEWDTNTMWNFENGKYALSYAGSGKYTGTIKAWSHEGNSQIAFIPELGASSRYAPSVDHEQLSIGVTSATLTYGMGTNCYFLPEGEFEVNVNVLENTVTIYHNTLYAIGTLDGAVWDINNGKYQLYREGDGIYSGYIDARGMNGYAQLAFFPTLGSWNDRYAPQTNHEILSIGVPSTSLMTNVGENCYFLKDGKYEVTVDIVEGKAMVHYPEYIYAIGTLDSAPAWDIVTRAYPLKGDGKGRYFGKINVWPVYDSSGQSYAQLAFVSKLTGNWGNIGHYRYGPSSDHSILRQGIASDFIKTDATCYFLASGCYDVEIDIVRGLITINETEIESSAIGDISSSDGNDFDVYPNPAVDTITLVSGSSLGNIYVYSIGGFLCKAIQTEDKIRQIDISTLPKGYYVVTSRSDSKLILKI